MQGQIDEAYWIRNRSVSSHSEMDELEGKESKWHEFNVALLASSFSDESILKEYSSLQLDCASPSATIYMRLQALQKRIRHRVLKLESIHDRLKLIPELVEQTHTFKTSTASNPVSPYRKIFVGHGQDDEAKDTVARFLEKLDLETVILDEEPSDGNTLIEKLEKNSDVGFAVILLTPDDHGGRVDQPEDSPRARQNAILELGYFLGKIGRKRVRVLNKGIEMPSVYRGVEYVSMDPKGAWRVNLAKEISHAGLRVDLNKITETHSL